MTSIEYRRTARNYAINYGIGAAGALAGLLLVPSDMPHTALGVVCVLALAAGATVYGFAVKHTKSELVQATASRYQSAASACIIVAASLSSISVIAAMAFLACALICVLRAGISSAPAGRGNSEVGCLLGLGFGLPVLFMIALHLIGGDPGSYALSIGAAIVVIVVVVARMGAIRAPQLSRYWSDRDGE